MINMSLKQIKTDTGLARQLSAILESGKVVHAFLIAGGSPQRRSELGNEFAKALLCPEIPGDSCGKCLSCRKFDDGNHEDFIRIVRMDGKQSILSEQVEELRSRLKFKPAGEKYVVLIEDAGSMNAISQNKLLKCLEEPLSETVMILLASGRDELLQTVVSRCSAYYIDGDYEDDEELRSMAAAFLRQSGQGAPYYKKKASIEPLLQKGEESRQRASAFADALEAECLEQLKRGGDDRTLFAAAEAAAELRKQIEQGHNVLYSLKQLCLKA